MRGGESFRSVFNAAENEEKKYRWLEAAIICAKLLSSTELPRTAMSEIFERIGRAYFLASFQASKPEDFRASIHKGIASYNKARTFLRGQMRDKEARSLHSRAMESYMRFWLARRSSAKKRFVTRSWALAKRAMKQFDKMKDPIRFAETFDLLSPAVPVALNLEWNPSKRSALYDEAIEFGRRCIDMLSDKWVDKERLARVSVRMALLIDASREERGEVRDQDELDKEGRRYWEMAVRVNEEAALVGLPRPPDGFFHIFENEQARRIWKKAMDAATFSKDRFAVGWLNDQLAGDVFWQAIRADDPKKCKSLSQESLALAEKAREKYECFNFSSPGASTMWPNSPYAEHFLQLSWFEVDREKRRLLLTKSIHETSDLMPVAKRSGYPKSLAYAHHIASRAQLDLSEFEPNPVKKRRLAEQALRNRARACSIVARTQPRSLWKRGVYLTYLAETKRILSELEQNSRLRNRLLLESIQTKAQAIGLSTKYVESITWGRNRPIHGAVGRQYADYGQILLRAFETLGDEKYLVNAADAFSEAVSWCRKASPTNRGIASYSWMAGRAHDRLQDYSTAANEFLQASRIYEVLSRKATLRSLFKDRARYLRAWATVEHARSHHGRLEYKTARDYYRKAAKEFKTTRRWNLLGPYYESIAELEHAETLSKLGKTEDAIRAFGDSSALFQTATSSLPSQVVEQERPEETTLIKRLADEPIIAYCRARMLIEEAKRVQVQGDYRTGSQKFQDASNKLGQISQNLRTPDERNEILFIASLSKGWALMTLGIGESSKQLLRLAQNKFEKTQTLGYNQNSRLLARAYALFSQGIEAANEFRNTFDPDDYRSAVKNLTMASDCFLESGFAIAYRQADAARHFLDAQYQISEADKQKDQSKKTTQLEMGITLLQNAADLFEKAHQPIAKEEATRLIKRLSEERVLSSSLAEISRAASNRLGAFTFPVPTRWGGTATDFQTFQGVDIEASLKTDETDHSPAEDLRIVVEVANVGTKSVRIVRLDNVIPEGVALVEAPSFSRIQGRSLIIDGKKLNASSVEKFPFVLKAGSQGSVLSRPRLVFLDDAGKQFELDLPPRILVSSRTLEFLSLEFLRDYTVKQLAPIHAGWRTFMEIVKALKISRSQLYGDPRRGRRHGKELEALMKTGLVELRVFPGERGRGGQIVKARLAYDNDVARQFAESLKPA